MLESAAIWWQHDFGKRWTMIGSTRQGRPNTNRDYDKKIENGKSDPRIFFNFGILKIFLRIFFGLFRENWVPGKFYGFESHAGIFFAAENFETRE